jgi:predicted transcriptional regulator of viral defense system
MSDHLCKYYLKFALSMQEREVSTQIAQLLTSNDGEFEIKDVRDKVAIEQHSHLSAIMTRLVQKGVLSRVHRGRYKFSDTGLVEHIRNKE